jgi:CubicO group peptidase (beta-lactamase class C family)
MKGLKFLLISGITIVVTALSFMLIGCSKDLIYFPGTVQEELEKGVEGVFDGMIVYVNQAGKSSFYSAGYNNRDEQIPADANVLFKIASISKLYLAAAAAKLIANGQLNLDAKLSELIPEVDGKIANAKDISLKLMVQHRSGIVDYSYQPEVEGETVDDYLSFAARVYGKDADFAPDKRYEYSNTNYLLLGEILDRTLGYSHHKYISNEILMPLGLKNTYNVYKDADTNHVMHGYLQDWEPSLRSWDFPLPGGSMVATAEDVGIFLRALIDGTLLSEKEQAIYSEIYEYEHTGWLPGYTSIARYHSDIDAVVVQFVNTSGKEILWLKLNRVYNRIVKAVEKQG